MDKRVLVMTGGTNAWRNVFDPNHEDNTMEEVYNLTLPSKERYASRHGYDFLSVRNFGHDTENKLMTPHQGSPWGPIGKLRMYRAFRLLSEYDVVVWFDADSVITNPECAIDHFGVNDSQSFYASYAWPWKNSFSTGNFIINKTEKSEVMFKTFYEMSSHFPDEQSAMNAMYHQNVMGMKSQMSILNHGLLDAIPSFEMYRSVNTWQNRQIPPYPWKKGDFLVHVGGIMNGPRIEIFKTYFAEYL